jgi:predicted MPP superfamily phosphohydrolase
MGIHVFKNSNVVLNRKSTSGTIERFLIAGVHDWHGEQSGEKYRSDCMKAALTNEPVAYKILLAHNPFSINQATKAGFHLHVSGHTQPLRET